MKEAGTAIAIFVGLAVIFGLAIWAIAGPRYAGEFYAGWLTEYSLSVDNLFIFLIIMTSLKVPRQLQQFALLVGIILALIFRGIFIAVGAAAINRYSWVFFIFGAFLLYTAVKLVIDYRKHEEEHAPDNAALRFVRKHFPSTDDYHGTKLTIVENGKRLITPMLVVIIALGSSDLLFALDSIPAIYGLTEEPYLVLTANIFALMWLRQLYFLIGGLLQRLVYLSYGLAVLLGFIGLKLILHAMHENELPFVNGGKPIEWAPDIPTLASLGVIVVILAVTTVASLVASAKGVEVESPLAAAMDDADEQVDDQADQADQADERADEHSDRSS